MFVHWQQMCFMLYQVHIAAFFLVHSCCLAVPARSMCSPAGVEGLAALLLRLCFSPSHSAALSFLPVILWLFSGPWTTLCEPQTFFQDIAQSFSACFFFFMLGSTMPIFVPASQPYAVFSFSMSPCPFSAQGATSTTVISQEGPAALTVWKDVSGLKSISFYNPCVNLKSCCPQSVFPLTLGGLIYLRLEVSCSACVTGGKRHL